MVSRTDNFVNLPDGPPFYFLNQNRRFYSLEPVPVRGGPEPVLVPVANPADTAVINRVSTAVIRHET